MVQSLHGESPFTTKPNLQEVAPTGVSTTTIAPFTTNLLTIVQAMSYKSCNLNQTIVLDPWVYVGTSTYLGIAEGIPITFSVPWATTFQTTTFTQTFPGVTLETLSPTLKIWNV